MKNHTHATESPNRPLANLWQGWIRFWFTPADPTPLALVRLCAGLIIFYVHLAYTIDLQELVGPHGWADLKAMDEYRHDFPLQTRAWDWRDMEGMQALMPEPAQTPAEEEFMRKWQVNPRQAFAKGFSYWSVWFHVTDPAWVLPVHVVCLVIFFLFAIGCGTRVTSVLAWLASVSYIQRSPVSLFGMDSITNVLLLYLMIGPSGAALSVDRLIARYWSARKRMGKRGAASVHEAEGPRPSVSANLALRLMQVHVCFIYLTAGLSKLQGNAWWNWTAVWGTMANPEFSPVHYSLYLSFLAFLSRHRWLWELTMSGSSIFTLAFEITFAFLVWRQSTRWLMLIAAIGMHLGIAVFMGLNTFSLSMIALVMSFIPVATVHWFLDALGGRRRERFSLAFNSRDARQARLAGVVHAVDAWGQVELHDDAAPPRLPVGAVSGSKAIQAALPTRLDADAPARAVQLSSAAGEVYTGAALVERLTRSLRLLWPLAPFTWLPGVNRLGHAAASTSTPSGREVEEQVTR